MSKKRLGLVLIATALFAAGCSGAAAEQMGAVSPVEGGVMVDEMVIPMEVMSDHADDEVAHDGESLLPVVEESAPHLDDHEDDHAVGTQEGVAEELAATQIRTVEVVMSEFAFSPGSIEVSAGETVEFVVINTGMVEHELRFSNAHRIEEHIASGHEGHGTEGGHHADTDVFVTVAPGATAELTVSFPEDTTVLTEIACLIPGHFEAGMKGTVTYVDA